MPFGTLTLNDGNKIPEIGFGTGTALYQKDATSEVVQALNHGFAHIDGAQLYLNEESIGKALKETGIDRSKVYVTTKYGGKGDYRETLETSLKKLDLDYVDLYLIHSPTFFINGDFEGGWKALEKIKEDGLAKSIGVSNFNVQQLERVVKAAKIKPAVNQISYHPYNNAEHAALLEYAAKHNIIIESYGGLTPLTKKAGGPVDPVVNKIAERLGATPGQVIMAWIKAKGVVIVSTTSKKERLQEYLAAGDLPPLTKEDVDAIDAAGSQG